MTFTDFSSLCLQILDFFSFPGKVSQQQVSTASRADRNSILRDLHPSFGNKTRIIRFVVAVYVGRETRNRPRYDHAIEIKTSF